MAENKQFLTNTQEKGSVMISEDVVAAIVCRAVEEIEGVAGLSTGTKKNWSKSIKITISNCNKMSIDCSINILYGQNIVTVASAVQEAITTAVNSMTGVKVKAVNVNVAGIIRK